MSGSVQELMQQARDLLKERGAPITTDNLNRAMTMLTGTGVNRTEQTAEGFDMNAQVDRVMQRSTSRPGTARPAANNVAARASNPPATPVGTPEPATASTVDVMPPPDRVETLTSAGYQPVMIPGEDTSYELPGTGPSANLDGNGMQNRLLRDLVMGAESAGAVSGAMPQVGAAYFGRAGFPDIRLGLNRPQIAGPSGSAAQLGDDAASAAITGGTRPVLPGSGGAQAQLPAPQAALPAPAAPQLGPMQQMTLRGPDLPATPLPGGMGPMQRATLAGPNPSGLGPMQRATLAGPRPQSAPKPRNMSAAQRQRRQNIAESP